jgi:hypothetical protein
MRVITLEDLHRHVIELWGGEDRIEWSEWGPLANHEERAIRIRPIRGEDDYAIALHEIGHIRDGLSDDVLAGERRAWEWARANALIWTPTMQRQARWSLGSYEASDDRIYHYRRILEVVNDLVEAGDLGVWVPDALIRNAVGLVSLAIDQEETRRTLIDLIDQYLAASVQRALTAQKPTSEQ